MTHAKLREAAEALKTNDPTNPAHRLARDLKAGRVSSLEQRDDLIAVLSGDAEKDATITRLEAELSAARAGLPDLSSVIAWLINGCETKHAIVELQIYHARIEATRQAAITGGE